jgi:DNA-binding NtrC family response regulator
MSVRKGQVLVVDDQEYVRESIAAILTQAGHHARTAATAEEGLASVASHPTDVVVSDLNLPGASGLELVRLLAREAPGVPVIVLTAHGTVASAVACIKAGAFDYIEKPADPEALAVGVDRALAWSRTLRELERLRRDVGADEDEAPIGESAPWRRVMDLVDAAAHGDATVLLLGESGAGKEVVARQVHRRSSRAEGPFVTVNCAAIAPDLFESEFFGHRRGSFTGATADAEGRFRLAHGGTLFLDEVSCLPMPSQAKLLRVLQDGCFERVGDPRSIHVDVRVVAATNADLDAEVTASRFRHDLLYRLDVVRIVLPPLRERRDDIPLLAARLLPRLALRARRHVTGIAPETLRLLCAYDWPGNVRELQNVLERAVILERSEHLSPGTLPFAEAVAERAARSASGPAVTDLREAATRAERAAIQEALRASGGVRREACKMLGIDPRNLAYYLKKHGIKLDRPDSSAPEGDGD